MFEIIVGIILAGFAIGGIWAYLVTKKTKAEGIETTAVVSRIEVHEWNSGADTGPANDVTLDHFITYVNEDGQTIEALLSNPQGSLEVGDKMKIRYLPDRQDYPVMIERL